MNGSSDQSPVTAELLGRLLDEQGPALALYASQFCDGPDDCVQEALIELAKQPRSPENVIGWLYRVVKHRALNVARGARRRRERETNVAQSRLLQVGDHNFDRLDALAITEALGHLAADQREIIVLRIWGGLTFEEIAAVLGSSKSTAQRNYHQALETLRERLESPCSTNPNPRCQDSSQSS